MGKPRVRVFQKLVPWASPGYDFFQNSYPGQAQGTICFKTRTLGKPRVRFSQNSYPGQAHGTGVFKHPDVCRVRARSQMCVAYHALRMCDRSRIVLLYAVGRTPPLSHPVPCSSRPNRSCTSLGMRSTCHFTRYRYVVRPPRAMCHGSYVSSLMSLIALLMSIASRVSYRICRVARALSRRPR